MSSKRQESAINTVAQVVDREYKAWAEGRLARMLLVDVKGTFNHISPSCLLSTMEGMEDNGDLM